MGIASMGVALGWLIVAWPPLADGTRITLPDRIVAEYVSRAASEEGQELPSPDDTSQSAKLDVSNDWAHVYAWSREGDLPEQLVHMSLASRERRILYTPRTASGGYSTTGFPLAFGVGDAHCLPTDALRMLDESLREFPERVTRKQEGGGGLPRVYRVHVPPRRMHYEVHVDLADGTVPRVQCWREAEPGELSGDWEFRDWVPAKGGGLVPSVCIWRIYPSRRSLDPSPHFEVARLVNAREATGEAPPGIPKFPSHATFTGSEDGKLYDSKFNIIGDAPVPASPPKGSPWASRALVGAGVAMTVLAGWVYARRRGRSA